ncbi:MAG: YifB family Mg chelatase-like AAA ATPase [Candidatus Hydrogenedentales bacterium]|jgi:magnesium chelatase family protein
MAKRPFMRGVELNSLLKRDHTLFGGVLFGLEGRTIELQARAVAVRSSPWPWKFAVSITGMATGSIREAIDRISGAFSKYEIPQPEVEIVINLAPADLPKEGTWLDLPLAIIMLQAAGILPDLPEATEDKFVLVGEMGLHGEVRRVPGVLAMAYSSKPGQTLIVPQGNEKECALIMAAPGHEDCKIAAVSTIMEVIEYFQGKQKLKNALSQRIEFEHVLPESLDLSRIRGHEKAKEAALIAAAGGHNLLLVGPPGEGKSLLASTIPGILPRLNNEDAIELTRIYSAAGALEKDGQIVSRRPMRSIHHSASKQALIGGGSGVPRPGEITMAHLGVLFLDELAEFSGKTLDSLRQPIEDGRITISRVGATIEYPSRFALVAAMNPCPCGYFGDEKCMCKESDVKKCQSKISGPVLDRLDLKVEMTTLSIEQRFSEESGPSSAEYRKRVELARKRQDKRFAGSKIPFNAAIPGGHVRDYCAFSENGFSAYRSAIEKNRVSTRSMDRIAKVARTIADLYNSEAVEPPHVDRATDYVVGNLKLAAF